MEEIINFVIALMLLFESVDFDFPGLASRLTVCLKDSKTKVKFVALEALAVIKNRTGSALDPLLSSLTAKEPLVYELMEERFAKPHLPSTTPDGVVEHMALSSVGDGGSQPSSSVGARSYTSEVLGHTQAPDTARVRDPRVVNSSDGGLSEKVSNATAIRPSRVGSAGTARIGSAGSSRRLPFSTPVPRAQIRVGSASSSRQLVDSASSSPSGGGGGGGGKPSNIGASPPDEDGPPSLSSQSRSKGGARMLNRINGRNSPDERRARNPSESASDSPDSSDWSVPDLSNPPFSSVAGTQIRSQQSAYSPVHRRTLHPENESAASSNPISPASSTFRHVHDKALDSFTSKSSSGNSGAEQVMGRDTMSQVELEKVRQWLPTSSPPIDPSGDMASLSAVSPLSRNTRARASTLGSQSELDPQRVNRHRQVTPRGSQPNSRNTSPAKGRRIPQPPGRESREGMELLPVASVHTTSNTPVHVNVHSLDGSPEVRVTNPSPSRQSASTRENSFDSDHQEVSSDISGRLALLSKHRRLRKSPNTSASGSPAHSPAKEDGETTDVPDPFKESASPFGFSRHDPDMYGARPAYRSADNTPIRPMAMHDAEQYYSPVPDVSTMRSSLSKSAEDEEGGTQGDRHSAASLHRPVASRVRRTSKYSGLAGRPNLQEMDAVSSTGSPRLPELQTTPTRRSPMNQDIGDGPVAQPEKAFQTAMSYLNLPPEEWQKNRGRLIDCQSTVQASC